VTPPNRTGVSPGGDYSWEKEEEKEIKSRREKKNVLVREREITTVPMRILIKTRPRKFPEKKGDEEFDVEEGQISG